jgi:Bacterial virulence factor lipase N-terminal
MPTNASRSSQSAAVALAVAFGIGFVAVATSQVKGADTPPAQALFDLRNQRGCPFPSNCFTVEDPTQTTGLRVNLAKPDCAARPSDCADLDVINTLDGFNITPRISIPFNGEIDLATVTSETVFLLRLGSTLPGDTPGSKIVGINQLVWDVATRTLHVEADEQLDQFTNYALFVTSGIRDTAGRPIRCKAFERFRHDLNAGQSGDPRLKAYRKELLHALAALEHAGLKDKKKDVVVASVFTTLSVTTELEKIRDQIKAGAPVAFDVTVFPLASVTDVAFSNQTGTAPTFAAPASFVASLKSRPGAIQSIAFGKIVSPDYRTEARVIPPDGYGGPGSRSRSVRTRLSLTSTCRRGRSLPKDGLSRLWATARSSIRIMGRPSSSRRRSPREGSRQSRSTAPATAAVR